MLDWDINHHLLRNFSENNFPNFHHVASETWIGIENYQTMIVFLCAL
jgi:hypothetical protein